MSEKRAYKKLKDALLLPGTERRLGRVENMCDSGWPDCNGCFDGIEFWIEIKEPTEPKRSTTPLFGSNHRLSVEQRNWIINQLHAGGLVYIYIDTGRHRMLMSGNLADKINILTLKQLLYLSLWHGVVPFHHKHHWEGIVDVILRREI